MTISFEIPHPYHSRPSFWVWAFFKKGHQRAPSSPYCVAKNCSLQQCRSHPTNRIEIGVCLSSNLPELLFATITYNCFIANYLYNNFFFFFGLIKRGADSGLLSVCWEDITSARIDSVYVSTTTAGLCGFNVSET